MKKCLFVTVAVAAAFSMFGLGGCGGGGTGPEPSDEEKTYSVTVENGDSLLSGSGKYKQGATVTIKAGTPPADTIRFKEWVVESGGASLLADKKKATITFVMPAADVRVRGVFEGKPRYKVTVAKMLTNSYAEDKDGNDSIMVGFLVYINAGRVPEDLDFVGWTSNNPDVVFADSTKKETTFIMPEGEVVLRANVTFEDSDGKAYKITIINNKTWMAENLNATPKNGISKCYGDSAASCKKYGQLYDWVAASVACPTGWHLPSALEWDGLINAAGGSDLAGAKLKAVTGWSGTGNGTDDYGFSALPGGRSIGGSNTYVNVRGFWWTSNDNTDDGASYVSIWGSKNEIETAEEDKGTMYSVRCLKD